MGTYTKIAITKSSIPPGKVDELVEWAEDNLMEAKYGMDRNGYFITFAVRKFRRRNNQKQELADKISEIYDNTKRDHWGEYEPQVLTKSEYSNKFSAFNWKNFDDDSSEYKGDDYYAAL